MKGVPYYEAGKGDTPRSCNSKAYLENYERIFKNARRKRPTKMPDDKEPKGNGKVKQSQTLLDMVRRKAL